MSTEELIVVTNVGLIVVTLVGIGASILANDKLANITKAAVTRILPGATDTAHGKHER
jgi:hypothetical protein